MKHRKLILYISIVFLLLVAVPVLLFSTGRLIYNGNNAEIGLPSIDTVARIKMSIVSTGINDGGIEIENQEGINRIMSFLYEAKVPIITTRMFWMRVANDVPLKETFLNVNIHGFDGELYRVCLYIEGDNGYAYLPYIGEYKIDQSIIEELMRMV